MAVLRAVRPQGVGKVVDLPMKFMARARPYETEQQRTG